MKKLSITLTVIVTALLSMALMTKAPVRKDGTDPGYTGSPGDSLKNCTACHGGTAYPIDGWVTSNIPEVGYEPGKTYQITVANKEVGATRFGFEVSPQNLAGDLMGSMIITDSVRTQYTGSPKYLTYTAEGVDGLDSNFWSFNWLAPDSGEVTFYAAFNSNFEGHKEGDKTYLSTLTVNKKGGNGLKKLNRDLSPVSIYPNPVSDWLNLEFTSSARGLVSIQLFDLSGKKVSGLFSQILTPGKHKLNLPVNSDIPRGNYLLEVRNNDSKQINRIQIK